MYPHGKRTTPQLVRFNPVEDVDLYDSQIITKISGRSARTRQRLANGRETRAFLEAALDLTSELFTPSFPDQLLGPDYEDVRPVMSYLSRRKVLAQARANNGEDFPLSENMIRHRWESHGDFLADFVSYALAEKYLALREAITRHATELLTSDEEFVGAVHLACYEDLQLVFEMPSFKFQLLAVATSSSDASALRALEQMYGGLSEVWMNLYTDVLGHYGFKFRPGIDVQGFNILLQAMTEGLALRLVAGVDEPLCNHEERTSLLGTATLSLFMALIDPGDGLNLEQATKQILRQRRHD